MWLSGWLIKHIPILQNINNDKWTLVILLLTFYLFIINGGTVITTLFLNKVLSREELLAKEIESIQIRRQRIIQQEVTNELAVTIYDENHNKNNKWSVIYDNIYQSITCMKKTLFNSKTYTGGEVIGIIERLLIFTFIVFGNYVSITFVIAAKSIARFKKIEQDSEFSDKFLVGTLSSATVAIFSGIVFNYFKKYFN